MHTHPNARLTSLGRERLLRRHIDQREPLAGLAAQAGISLRTAYKWLDPQQLQHAVDLRHQRCTLRRNAKVVDAPLPTVGRVMKSLGLGRLRNLDPKPPARNASS